MNDIQNIEARVTAVTATGPQEFVFHNLSIGKVKISPCRLASLVLTPYPGWRFVPHPDGGMRHEKIPSLWRRIVEAFR